MLHDAGVDALSTVAVAANRFFICMRAVGQAASQESDPTLHDICGDMLCDG